MWPAEELYAQKGQVTLQFPYAAAAERQNDPWDSSFDGWCVGTGAPYMVDYGKLGYSEHPIFSPLFSHAMYDLKRAWKEAKLPNKKFNADKPVTIIVTNRLAWGDKKEVDYTIGDGVVSIERKIS